MAETPANSTAVTIVATVIRLKKFTFTAHPLVVRSICSTSSHKTNISEERNERHEKQSESFLAKLCSQQILASNTSFISARSVAWQHPMAHACEHNCSGRLNGQGGSYRSAGLAEAIRGAR